MGTGDEEYDYLFKGKYGIIVIKTFTQIFHYVGSYFIELYNLTQQMK